MPAFFIKTDTAAIGPFSDVELRELAFSGILKPESNIATSLDGTWQTAQSIELFSFQRLHVPHPQGTVLPHFEVQGLPSAFHGPFKLRELFGFAARGMLPPDALIKGEAWEEWLSVLRFPTLVFCLNGDLAMLGPGGQLILRATGNSGTALNLVGARAPMEIAQQAAARRAAMLDDKPPGPAMVDEGYEAEQATIHAANATAQARFRATVDANSQAMASVAAKVAGETRPEVSNLGMLLASLGGKLTIANWVRPIAWSKRATLLAVVLMLLLVGGVAYAYSRKQPTPRDHVIGEWIGSASGSASKARPSFGISLHDDGNCEVVNSSGPAWQGDYFYSDKHDLSRFYDSLMPVNSVVDSIEPRHYSDPVQSTDGYIRFVSIDGTFPLIDGHPLREAFVRLGQDQLQLGYLATVNWTADEKILEAGWIKLIRAPSEVNEN